MNRGTLVSSWSAVAIALVTALHPVAAGASDPPSEAHDLGIDLAGMDRSVRPGNDFYAYANGAWIKATQIPAERADIGVNATLEELADQRTADLIREAGTGHPAAGSLPRKIADYYASLMDAATIDKRGPAPLERRLARIAAIADRTSLAAYLGSTLRADVDVLNATYLYTDNLFGLWVAQDLDDPAHYSPFLLQGGLGLPDREYYLDDSPGMREIRAKYRGHIMATLRLAGRRITPQQADAILALEHRIAEAHSSRQESIEVLNGNNHWSRAELADRAPGLDWTAFLAAAGLSSQQQFVIWQPRAVVGISALVATQPLETWRAYLTLRAIDRAAPFLPKAFVDERFAFYGKVLSGAKVLRPRWKRAVSATNAALGDAIGKLYAERYFPAAEKRRVEAMVQNLLGAFGRRIDRLDWMAPDTKAEAKRKLATLKVGVGYPDSWRDFGGLVVVRGDAFGNAERASAFNYAWQLAKLGRPVDRSEWVTTPQTVNAFNLPAMNALNFPAANLVPPNLDPRRPVAMDYGAIGATIGHEISHSFDDQGALFDSTGRLRNWWTPEDFAHFKASGARLVAQYSAYRPFPDLPVNGQQTLGENIADVAGLAVALDAYEASGERATAPTVAGFTPEQQFFLSFAQSWREKDREPALREQLLADGHSPSEYRADTVRNLDAWYAAFGVEPGDALYLAPDARVGIW